VVIFKYNILGPELNLAFLNLHSVFVYVMLFKSPNRVLSLHFDINLSTAALSKSFAIANQQIWFQIGNRNLLIQYSEIQHLKIL
jgi:hypothetical protein